MRYIGNKTKLLGEIEAFATDVGATGESLLDIFAGTASVARHFKRLGYRILSNDFMRYSYVLQKAYVEPTAMPSFRGIGGSLDEAIHRLRSSPGQEGIIFRQFTPGGEPGRRFFTEENGARIDGFLHRIRSWREEDRISETEFYVLLAPVIEAADRVANISGVYGAYLKRWEGNARKEIRLEVPDIGACGEGHQVFCEDGNRLVREVEADILYVDPPYNHRQYAANYHVLEVIAEIAEMEAVGGYEDRLYGKTGLRPYEDQRSEYCMQKRAEDAFRDLIRGARCRHIIVSYNEEGIISREAIEGILGEGSPDPVDFRPVRYRRFRSDALAGSGRGRSYRVLEGRGQDEIEEWLFHARRGAR